MASNSNFTLTKEVGVIAGEFTWIIPDFQHSKPSLGYFLSSSVFEVKGKGVLSTNIFLRFQINIGSRGEIFLKNCGRQNVSIANWKVTLNHQFFDRSIEAFVLAGKPTTSERRNSLADSLQYLGGKIALRESHKKHLLQSKDLHLKIELTLALNDSGTTHLCQTVDGCSLFKKLRTELKDEPTMFSDAILVSQGKEFPCHKLILASKSPVFKAMFLKDRFTEATSGRLDVKVLSPEKLEKFIDYIYTDWIVFEDGADCMEIYAAAHFYDIKDLRLKCEASLNRLLSINNVVDMYQFLDLYIESSSTLPSPGTSDKQEDGGSHMKLEKLRNECVTLISRNISQIKKTAEWEKLRQDSVAFNKLFELVCNLQSSSGVIN